MKKICLAFFTILFLQGHCQSLYEIKFRGHGDTTRYTCFLVYNNENDSYMRIKYYNKQGQFRVVQIKYKGESGKYTDGVSFFSLNAESLRFITSKSEKESYNPDYFVWMGNESLPYTSDQKPDANGSREVYQVDGYRKLQVSELTKTYLRTFYGSSEPDYIAFLKMSGDYQDREPVYTNRGITMHLMVLANTDISDVGSGCEVDMRHLKNEFQSIAETLGIGYAEKLISGYSFSKQSLLTALNNLDISSNDIVIFVYRGHGFRWSNQQSNYPSLALTRSHTVPVTSENTIGLETVYNTIKAKGGRLNIVLGDCCNTDIGVNQWTNDNYLYMQSNASADYSRLYELFINRKGSLLVSASAVGEVSWTSGVYGGFFTSSFLQALVEEFSYLKTTVSSWTNIISNTRRYALAKSNGCSTCTNQNAIAFNQITIK